MRLFDLKSGEVTLNERSPTAGKAVQDMMPTRNLGKTGFRARIFGLGGQGALEKANNESGVRIWNRVAEHISRLHKGGAPTTRRHHYVSA